MIKYLIYTEVILFLWAVPISANSGIADFKEKGLERYELQYAARDSNSIKESIEETNDLITYGEYDKVRGKIDSIRNSSEEIGFEYGRAYSYLLLGLLCLHEQKYDSTEIIAEPYLQHEDARIKVRAHQIVGVSYSFRGDFQKATNIYLEALSLAENLDDKMTLAGIQQSLARIYSRTGQRKMALEYYLSALNLALEIDDAPLLVSTYINLGLETWGDEDEERAIYYLEKALDIAENEKMVNNQYRIKLNLANIYSFLDDYTTALDLYNQALEHYLSLPFELPPIIILYNKGSLYRKMGNYAKAESMLLESLGYSKEYGLKEGLFYNSMDLGQIEVAKGNYENAEHWLNDALQATEEMGSISYKVEVLEEQYKLYKSAGRLGDALIKLEEFKEISDSLYEEEKTEEIAMLEDNLEIVRQTELNNLLREKHVHQEKMLTILWSVVIVGLGVIILISLLLRRLSKLNKNNIITNKNLFDSREELRSLNEDLKKLFSIIAHDIHSPIAAMQGILSMMRETELSKEDQAELLENLEVSLQTNATAMEDILIWSRNQMKGFAIKNEEIDLNNLVDQIIEKQKSQARIKGIKIVNEVKNGYTIITDESALDLILRNLLSNSIKYTSNGDTIAFNTHKNNTHLKIGIADTGVGMSQEMVAKILDAENLVSTKGTKGETGSGYGLHIVKEFIKRIDGSLEVESEPGKGSIFSVVIPLKPD